MAKEATRERKLRFIETFGRFELRALVADMVDIEGADFLTDEQIDRITARKVEDERYRQQRNISNRARMAALGEVA